MSSAFGEEADSILLLGTPFPVLDHNEHTEPADSFLAVRNNSMSSISALTFCAGI